MNLDLGLSRRHVQGLVNSLYNYLSRRQLSGCPVDPSSRLFLDRPIKIKS